MSERICAAPGCDNPVPVHIGRGRPAKHCSAACRKAAHRKQKALDAELTSEEAKVAAVFRDPELSARLQRALDIFRSEIGRAVAYFDSWQELPSEFRGRSLVFKEYLHKESEWYPRNALHGHAMEKVAALVYTTDPSKLSGGTVYQSIKGHIIDHIRKADGWGYVRVLKHTPAAKETTLRDGDGKVTGVIEATPETWEETRVTRRLDVRDDRPSFETARGESEREDPTGERAAWVAAAPEKVRALDFLELVTWVAWIMSRYSREVLAEVHGSDKGFLGLFDRERHRDPMTNVYRWAGLFGSKPEVLAALVSAREKMGGDPPAELGNRPGRDDDIMESVAPRGRSDDDW